MGVEASVEVEVADAIFFVALEFCLLNASASCLSKPACFNLLKSNGILFIIRLVDAVGRLRDCVVDIIVDCE